MNQMRQQEDAGESEEARAFRERGIQVLRWSLIFAAAFACIWAGTRWAGSAVHYAALATNDSNIPQYQVSGTVKDTVTKGSVPWATVTVSGTASTTFIQTTADLNGNFSLNTFAQRQNLTIEADGYAAQAISVGPQWYSLARGNTERLIIELIPR